jgi:TPR repeat protein
VPPLNLTVRLLDHASIAITSKFQSLKWVSAPWAFKSSPRQANFAHMAIWIALFVTMAGTGFVGRRHPGADAEFWRRACEQGRHNACQTWIRTLNVSCQHASGRACMTLAVVLNQGRVVPRDLAEAGKNFGRACDLGVPGLPNACSSLFSLVQSEGPDVFQPACDRGDGESCFILASLHYVGRGVPKDYSRAAALFRHGCENGWWRACGGLAECYRAGHGTAADPAQAIAYFEKACRSGIAPSCFSAAAMYRAANDEALARQRVQQGCEFSARYAEASAAYFRPGSSPQAAAPSGTAPPLCAQ